MATHIIIILMGLSLCFIILKMKAPYKPYRNFAKAPGTVSGFETVKQKKGSITVPVINFTTGDGVSVFDKSEESLLSPKIHKGTKVRVLYNPANPKEFIAKGKHFNTYAIMILLSGAAFSIAGIILLLNDLHIINLPIK